MTSATFREHVIRQITNYYEVLRHEPSRAYKSVQNQIDYNFHKLYSKFGVQLYYNEQ